MEPRPSDIIRFLDKVMVLDDGCWEWTSVINGGRRGGYGYFWFDGKMIGAHVFSQMVFNGPVPEGETVHHFECNRTDCVNPKHLQVATFYDNVMEQHERLGNPNNRKPDDDIPPF